MELKDTIEMMNSPDYKERFKAEYYQTLIRANKLGDMIKAYEAGTLSFKPKCSLELLEKQMKHMVAYLFVLNDRAEIEGIEL